MSINPAPKAPRKKSTWWKSKPAIGVAALLIGTGVGSAGQADPTDSDVYQALQEEHAVVSSSVEEQKREAKERAAELEAQLAEIERLTQENKTLQAQEEALKVKADDLEESVKTLEAERKEAAERKEELEKAASTRESPPAATNATDNTVPVPFAPKKQESAPAPKAPAKPAPQPAPKKTQTPAPAKAYYKNCTAAWDAGAAPVYAGDPGYAKHLDRDGDGVGCEKPPR